MIALVGLMAAQGAVLLWLLHRTDRDAANERAVLLEALAEAKQPVSPDLVEMVELVDRLCQRIQAPEIAINDHMITRTAIPPSPPAVRFDDDEDFWESQSALADRVMAAEVAARGPDGAT